MDQSMWSEDTLEAFRAAEFAKTVTAVKQLAEDIAEVLDVTGFDAEDEVTVVRDIAHFTVTTEDGRKFTVSVSPSPDRRACG